ncbi:hypothetical protein PHYC_02738 [Phycisphaerales bacterium]|nr:hypothetical protein PHYC_02738 [Phycisphaerales bacterium]
MGARWMQWVLVMCMFALALAGVPGCKKKTQDFVLDQYKKGERAIAEYDLEAYKSTLMPETLAAMENELALAIHASEEEVKKLRPSTMMYVLALRNRQAAAYLKNMKIDDYVVWLMEQGFLVVDAERDIYPYEVSIAGDTATVQMGIKVDVPSSSGGMRFGRRRAGGIIASALVPKSKLEPLEGYTLMYRKVNGVWLSDGTAMAKSVDETIISAARDEEMRVHEFLVQVEEEAHGSIKASIWSPAK